MPDKFELNEHVKSPQGRPGIIVEFCDEFAKIKFDDPVKDVIGQLSGGWYRLDKIHKTRPHAPQNLQDQPKPQ